MRELDIRPLAMFKERQQMLERENAQLLLQRHAFVNITCPACDGDSHTVRFVKQGFQFVACTVCQTTFVNPRPTRAMLEDRYTHAESIRYFNEKIFPASEPIRRTQIFVPRVQRVVELWHQYAQGRRGGVLFDVGAGFGTFCEEMQRMSTFNRVVAVEPNCDLAATCRRRGIEVIERLIEDVQLEHADVIVNFELIEHLFSPREFLIACHRTLTEDGLLVLTTPNILGFDLRILGEHSDNICAPAHLNYFHPESLTHLLEACHFEVVQVLTPGQLDVDIVRRKAVEGTLPLDHRPFLRFILQEASEEIRKGFQDFLVRSHLSSNMWIVARRRT